MFFTCTAQNHEHCTHGAQQTAALDTVYGDDDAGAAGGGSGGDGYRTGTAAKKKTLTATKTEGRGGKRGGQLRIDIHCHYMNNEVSAKAAPLKPFEQEPSIVYANQQTRQVNMDQMKVRGPKLSDIATRLRDMDRMGIDIQVVSPAPSQYYYYADPDFGLALARDVNDRIAEIVATHPDRFVGIGTLPLQDPKMAVRELERCVKKLGMRGVEIGTNVNGIDLADKRLGLDRFFAKAQELDVMIFLHPMGFTHADRMTDYYFNNIIGNPLESTLAVSHLIFGGVLERYPRLKFVVAHGGGYLAHYSARMDHGWKVRPDARTNISKKPSSYLKKFYFDTVTFDPGQVDALVEKFGAKHVVMGSDYPFDMGDDNPVKLIESVERLSDTDRKLIMGGNTARLLNIRARRA